MKIAFPIAPWARCLPLVGLLLAGCATFEPQAGRESVRQSIQQKTGLAMEPASPSARAESATALSADDAVRIALNNSPGVAALLAELDGAEAQAVQGSLQHLQAWLGQPQPARSLTVEEKLNALWQAHPEIWEEVQHAQSNA